MKSFIGKVLFVALVLAVVILGMRAFVRYSEKHDVKSYLAQVWSNGPQDQATLNDLERLCGVGGGKLSPSRVVEMIRLKMPDLEPEDIGLVEGWGDVSRYQRKFEVAMVFENAKRLGGTRIECRGTFCDESDVPKFLKEVFEMADTIRRVAISNQELQGFVDTANFGAKLTQVLWLYPVERNFTESPTQIAEYASWFYKRAGMEIDRQPVIDRFKTEAYARRAQYLITMIQVSSYPQTQRYAFELQHCLKDGGLTLEDFRVNKEWLEKAVGADPRLK